MWRPTFGIELAACTPASHEALARDWRRYLEETRHAGFVADDHCVIELRVHGRCRATLRRVIYDNRKKLQVG